MSSFPPDNEIVNDFFLAWPTNLTPMSADVDSKRFSILSLGFDSNFTQSDFADWALYMRQTWWVPIVVALVYCELVFVGQKYMRDRKPMDLKLALCIWNSILAIFSIMCSLKIVPYFVYTFLFSGPAYFITRIGTMSYGQGGEVSFWCFAFVMSKYVELIDTAFLVLRKKPVALLHWYHHATVLVLSIQSMAVLGPTGVVMAAMNSLVHSVMYTYYAIAAVARPPRWGKIVTRLQIAQMIAGTVMGVAVFGVPYFVPHSYGVLANNAMIVGIYVSYLVLFAQFYSRRYQIEKAKSV